MKHSCINISTLFVLVLCILFTGITAVNAQKIDRMNVLFIVSDDLCVNAAKEAATPHMDRLASMSMTFSQAYCQYPVCCPSRNSFLAGMRPDELEARWAPFREVAPDVTALPQLFRENGYYTASIGKIFHVDGWDARWPDEGWEMGDEKSWDFRINCPPANQGKRRMPPFPRKGLRLDWPGHTGAIDYGMMSYESDLAQDDGQATQEAIRQLDLPKDKPFFLAVGYRRPHAPFVAPEKYFWPYPLNALELPDPGNRSDVTDLAFTVVPPNYGDPEAMKKMKMCYMASVSFLDSQVGRLLESLEDHKLLDSTIIIFFSDHGFQLGEHGEWHKFTLFEESAQTPLMIRIPGVTTGGAASNALVQLVDLYPTLKEFCSLPDPVQELDGRSLMPVLRNPGTTFQQKPAFTQVSRKLSDTENVMGYSVRFKDYRYNEWWTTGEKPELIASELYDLVKDPKSEVNQSENRDFKSVRKEMSSLINDYREK